MAKTYAFRFSAIPCTFTEHGYEMEMTLMIAPPSETKVCTLAEAVAYLPEFSASRPEAHLAMLAMANRRDRLPPGFNKARTEYRGKRPTAAEISARQAELQAEREAVHSRSTMLNAVNLE